MPIVLVLLVALAYFFAPLQVKEITHTYQSTTVKLWFPQIVKVKGNLEFESSLKVDITKTDGKWNWDSLRDMRMWCGKGWCQTSSNPVFAEWIKTRQAIELAEKELASIGSKLSSQKAEVERLQKYIEDYSCDSAVRPPTRPTWACAAADQVEVAKQLCYAKELGAKACEKFSKDKIPDELPSLLRDAIAREGCAATMAEATGFDFNLGEKTIKKYTIDLPITLIIEGAKKLSKLFGEVVDGFFTVGKAEACIPAGINHCRNIQLGYEQTLIQYSADATNLVKHCTQAISLRDSASASYSRQLDLRSQAEKLIDELRTLRIALEVKVDVTDVRHLLS
jgi:hypothetical protein